MRAELIDGAFVPRPAEAITSVELDGEVVLYDDRTLGLHLLNDTAASAWLLADGSRTVDAIVDQLSAAYGVDVDAIHDQVVGLVRELGSQGLLDGVDAATTVPGQV
jgi:hypothetical protein